MSEDLAPGSVSLEDDPTLEAVIAEGATITGPDPTASVEETEEEPAGTITASENVKFVPFGAVKEERLKRQEATKAVEAMKAQLAEAQAKAEQWDRMRPAVEQAMPLIDKLRGRADILAQLDKPPSAPEAPAGPLSAQEAIDYAKDLDLYTADGQLDVNKAQRLATRQEAIAAKQAQRMVAPYEADKVSQQSAQVRAQIASIKDANGETVPQAVLDMIWNSVPPELSSKPEVGSILYYAARGYAAHHAKNGPPMPSPVVPTEGLGGSRAAAPSLSAIEERVRKAAGMSTKDFTASAGRFKPGERTVLED